MLKASPTCSAASFSEVIKKPSGLGLLCSTGMPVLPKLSSFQLLQNKLADTFNLMTPAHNLPEDKNVRRKQNVSGIQSNSKTRSVKENLAR